MPLHVCQVCHKCRVWASADATLDGCVVCKQKAFEVVA